MSKPQPVNSTAEMYVPAVPLNVENTGLDFGFLADLALKTVYADANCATDRAAEKLKLSMPVTEELLQHLYREKFIEIRGLLSYGNNRYGMLDRGWQRAHRLLEPLHHGLPELGVAVDRGDEQAEDLDRPVLAEAALGAGLGDEVAAQ